MDGGVANRWGARTMALMAFVVGMGSTAVASAASLPPSDTYSSESQEGAEVGSELDESSPARRPMRDFTSTASFAGLAPFMLGMEMGTIRRSEGPGIRLGTGVFGTVRPMRLSPGAVRITVPYVSMEGCASVDDRQLMFRLCGGPLVGASVQRWQGFEDPGPRRRPWVAGRMSAQYAWMMGRDMGVTFGFDFTVPLVSAFYRSRDSEGNIVAQRRSRPVGYMLRIGVAFRGRSGGCSHGCPVRSTAES